MALSSRCVDLLAFERFYVWTELLGSRETEKIREEIRTFYPELPAMIGGLRPSHAKAHNAGHIRRLQAESYEPVSYEEARAIHVAVQQHPVARLSALPQFDPTRRVGFCFGRAHAAFFEARRRCVDERSLRKFFLVGELVTPSRRWDFHSTLGIAGDNSEGWWAIDPILSAPVLPSEWLRLWTEELAEDPEETNLFFAVSPHQITRNPHDTLARALEAPPVREFFRRLVESYEAK